MKTIASILIVLAMTGAAHAQSAFPTTESQARLSQRSMINGDHNIVGRDDTIYQSAQATALPAPGTINPYAQAYLNEKYGSGPIFSYDKSFVNQFGYSHGRGNTLDMTYSGLDNDGTSGYGGIDKKVIIAEQIAVQRGDGNSTHLRGDITQRGRPMGSSLHGDLLDLNLDVITQVGVQVGNNNDLRLDLQTEQSDQ